MQSWTKRCYGGCWQGHIRVDSPKGVQAKSSLDSLFPSCGEGMCEEEEHTLLVCNMKSSR